MKRHAVLSTLCLVLLVVQLALAGCAAPTPTPLPPTATAVPPTKAPAPTVAPTTAPAAPAAATGDLVLAGAVEKTLGLKEADLRAMKVVKITAEHPKSGSAEYEGVRLSDLLALAKPTAAATKVIFTAADGFTAEVDLPTLTKCADCMVAFTNTPGKLKLAMPALPSNLWVKDVMKLEFSTQAVAAAPTKAPEPTKAPAPTAAPTATSAPVVRKPGTLLMATTTSTADTGLLTAILPIFEKANNCKVDFVAVGSGQAIEIGRKGDADVLLVHSRAAEDKFVTDGFAMARYDVMYNDFVVIGPKDDPAKVTGMTLAKDAFKAVMDKGLPFASRGDNSGTHTKEKAIWATLSVTPTKELKWYNLLGQGMGDTLLFSNEQKAYTLADRGTWLAMKDKTPNLALLVGGDNLANNKDKDLLNPYGLLAVSPDKFPSVNYDLAMKFIGWMTSVEGQKALGSFGVDKFGQSLFYPSSDIYKAVGEKKPNLMLSSTITPIDAGILGALEEAYTKKTGVTIGHVGAGTGKTIEAAKGGAFDLVIVHARAMEDQFVAAGYGVDRRDVMYNDFVILGPASDPASIKGEKTAAAALAKIAQAKALFVTRGDNSGTHVKEKELWAAAKIQPAGDWYVTYEKGSTGNAPTTRYANERGAYLLMDRATYITLRNEIKLQILVEKDPAMFNYIAAIRVNPDKFPQVNAAAAKAFQDWLVSDEAQTIIKNFGVDKYGEPLFYPNAKK